MIEMSSVELNCLRAVKNRERICSFKIRITQDDNHHGAAIRNGTPNTKSNKYPIEIMEESVDSRQVKIHYTGYSKRYDEWIRKSQIEYTPVPLRREACRHDVRSHNLSTLACCIKQKLVPNRKTEDPKVRIQLAFDNSSFELLKGQGIPLPTKFHGHQSYGIQEYKDLDKLLGT